LDAGAPSLSNSVCVLKPQMPDRSGCLEEEV
jgi:hypothetical protein